ncbi:unnamed protein product [Peronospora destructor]|uniref:Protein kinase domain-containing protein n=2 Tax=Peronospora destructor TaxID=86335 RepID=A0AAV0UYT7_9STRA|nr:unnamed protein product [Peronospora destructor]
MVKGTNWVISPRSNNNPNWLQHIFTGCSCRLSDVASASNWVDLRPLSTTSALPLSSPQTIRHPGLYTARHRVTHELVALKVLDRRLLRQRATRRRLRQEICALQLARDHENLLQLYEVKVVGKRVELAFELARGGEVLQKLRSERDVSHVLQQAAQGLQFLHERGVIHGQVRPEHLLFSDDEPSARVLLTAFGRAAPWRFLTLRCYPKTKGFLWNDTHHIRFLPPFLLRRKNRHRRKDFVDMDDDGRSLVANWEEAQQIDIWALGVTLYVMLCASFPFSSIDEWDDNVVDIERRMLQDRLTFPADGALLSRAARDLLHRLLAKNQDATMNINEVVAHPWLNSAVAPAVSWSDDMLAQHSVFTTRYADEVTAAAHRPSVSTSKVLDIHNEVANAPASGISKLTSFDEARSIVDGGGGALLKCGTLEGEVDEEEARPSFMSTHGTQLLLDDEAQQERPSAECYMRLASDEMEGQNMHTNSDVEDKSLDKIWQVLLRQRRFFSKSLSSGSSIDR